tara:strand:- start:729 stop:959 length:231 start_codon:yes stop_codon:yes gene_type:complete
MYINQKDKDYIILDVNTEEYYTSDDTYSTCSSYSDGSDYSTEFDKINPDNSWLYNIYNLIHTRFDKSYKINHIEML